MERRLVLLLPSAQDRDDHQVHVAGPARLKHAQADDQHTGGDFGSYSVEFYRYNAFGATSGGVSAFYLDW